MKIASLHIGHDASSSFFDGVNLAYFLEERYSRIKHDDRYNHCLKKLLQLNIKFDFLVISSFDNQVLNSLVSNPKFKRFVLDYKKRQGESPQIIFDHSHHLHHASLAFYNSHFDRSLVFVIDGSGQNEGTIRECESVYIAEYPDKFIPIYKNYLIVGPNNPSQDLKKVKQKYPGAECTAESKLGIASLYGSCASHFSESELSAGKVMGIQSYGNTSGRNYIKNKFYINDIDFSIDYKLLRCYNKNIKIFDKVKDNNFKILSDYAKDLQKQTEQMMLSLIDKYVNQTNVKNVCISGGYGMNVIANTLYQKTFPEVQFYNEPLSMDCGISLGSCFYYYRNKTRDMEKKPIINPCFHGGLTKIH